MTDQSDWPDWLKQADTKDAQVEILHGGGVVWHSGRWQGGKWRGGTWLDGIWNEGDWHGGRWNGGIWQGGSWHGGIWQGGEWDNGIWLSGIWRGGLWHGGTWLAAESRIHYMASLAGIAYDGTQYLGYRVTQRDGRGRYTDTFVQPEGNYYEDDIPPSGSGTCVAGIHVTSAARAWTYFGIDPNAQMWEVRFSREDLLDCDGEKARIRGGVFKKIERPF